MFKVSQTNEQVGLILVFPYVLTSAAYFLSFFLSVFEKKLFVLGFDVLKDYVGAINDIVAATFYPIFIFMVFIAWPYSMYLAAVSGVYYLYFGFIRKNNLLKIIGVSFILSSIVIVHIIFSFDLSGIPI